ncbi:MAG: PSD1 domain-containing protein [Planctomycetaceae bacterium]|nr:PSD1 domain-containing protein [Planctomycetaceae bacterium]
MSSKLNTHKLAALICCCVLWGDCRAEEVDYLRDIKPLLKARCYACHGSLKQEAGLRLDTAQLLLKGGSDGPIVTANAPDQSPLLRRVHASVEEGRMPPEGEPLTPEQQAQLKQWIMAGAKAPADETPEADPRDHWSFRPLERPLIPFVLPPSSHPIDQFVAREHVRHGLVSVGRASREALLRRAWLDLLGVPPDPESLRKFLADESPDAWEKTVDALLNDPRYGERWGRHWMDVWRYADWYGRRAVPDVWNSAPQIWRWRDWIVRSLNQDKGYDRMIQEMLAADEICPEDDEAAVATGYLIRNWYALNPNDWMRNTVEHTGKAFLGLTFNCAHCHDHKYDPIAQDDYFRLRAFFEPMNIRQDQWPGEPDPGPFQEYEYVVLRKIQRLGMVRIVDQKPEAPTWFYTGGDERNRVKDRGSVAPGVPSFLSSSFRSPEPISMPAHFRYPGLRPAVLEAERKRLADAVVAAEAQASQLVIESTADSTAAQNALTDAERVFAAAIETARTEKREGALDGQQSLLMDASTGRRMIHRTLPELKELPDRTTVEFLVQIQKDAHFNFQLARDLAQGGTATFVGFEKGRILSYRPGTFEELQVGAFDLAQGVRRFRVHLTLDLVNDVCRLTVTDIEHDQVLCDAQTIALNGWKPVGNANQGILMDARTGTVAIVDRIRICSPVEQAAGLPQLCLYECGFESPNFADGEDAVGVAGWVRTSYSAEPATSVASTVALNDSLREAAAAVRRARGQAALPEWKRQASQLLVNAARADQTSWEARLRADQKKAGLSVSAEAVAGSISGSTASGTISASIDSPTEDLARIASRLERDAAVFRAEVSELLARIRIASAESLPDSDEKHAKDLEVATKELAAARTQLASAKTLQSDASKDLTYTPLTRESIATSTGRRKALAEWITSSENPLTARVAVNHIWMRHFHRPIVSSVFDFGRNGAPPSHPDLLNWLACELRDHDWSMKHLHRLILTSETWKRSSGYPEGYSSASTDPDNRWLWRMNTGRMEAEVVRDSVLAVSEKLDLTQGGQELENSAALTTFRRSLYYSCQPEGDGRSQFAALFDAADALECYRRSQSIIPQQALALTNSEFVHQRSADIVAAWVAKVENGKAVASDSAFVEDMFELIVNRRPSDSERQRCTTFLEQQSSASATSSSDAAASAAAPTEESAVRQSRESLVRVLLNHNDFIAIR